MNTSPPSPELVRLKKQAVKRFHPDNAVDKEDEIGLTRLMQEANAAFDVRDEAALRAVFAPKAAPPPPPPQAPPNAWGPRTYAQQAPPTGQQTRSGQQAPPPTGQGQASQPVQTRKLSLGCKVWFRFLVGLFASLFTADNRSQIQQRLRLPWTSRKTIQWSRAWNKGTQMAVFVPAVLWAGWHFGGNYINTPAAGVSQGVSLPSPPETDYAMGIKRAVAKEFLLTDLGVIKPPDGAAVDMKFQIGPTGSHNAASVVKSSGYGALDWACTQAVYRVHNFGSLPVSDGGLLNVYYRCAFNAPDTVTKLIPLTRETSSVKTPSLAQFDDQMSRNMPTPPIDLSAGMVSKAVPGRPDELSGERFGRYVTAIKNTVAHNWYLNDVLDTPAGSTVYVKFSIGKMGYPEEASIQTSSGYPSLDQSCLEAVRRVNNFGPLPPGYKEDTLNVVYHCTYPGRSVGTSGEISDHVASVSSEFTLIRWNGTYTGTVHNNISGQDADIRVIIEKKDTAAIKGYLSVALPLYGSGPLSGSSVVNNGIEFHVDSSQAGFGLDFKGYRRANGLVTGTYTTDRNETGIFTMMRR
jgi:TonB family protein